MADAAISEVREAREAEGSTGVGDRAPLSASARWWIWGLSIAFIVHDGEEALVTLRTGELRSFGAPLTVSQALAAFSFELALCWLLSVLAVWSGRPGWPMRLFGWGLAGFTIHAVGHLGAAVVGTGYVFGATTAPLVLVYGGLALHRLRAERLLSRKELYGGLAGSVVVLPPFLFLVHAFGRLIG